ncbi:MAG: hypothetical protein CMP67_06155 [Flavobacteriales bacterium]|nr:hypothetical protein [Flavobacteriales bacterium]MBO73120.1 hypothetical protein [Flavobacteriales bacterium]|tara:strand:+ start:1322 stop:5002 length:3681 start_codon:yes stop_codon:yes gene_type:complete
MEKKYSFINNVTGWSVLLFSTVIYVLTIESTASFWDCGEFIASATKLQVGHPPGAPLWSMKARMFAFLAEIFTGGTEYIAFSVNVFSALCSSFTILFLFWSITALAKKITLKSGELTAGHTWGIMFSGLVGSLAFTFSDSFWFSAVEAEVYAASSLYTAAVFWLALKWDANASKTYADRYLILIAYLMGLSIGVHILNLLVIPAIVYIYYFNKKKATVKGFFITGVVGVLILGVIQQVVISYSVEFATKFELYFVNEKGLGFDAGMWIYFLLIGAFLIGGIILTKKKGFPQLQKAFLCVMVILIGYSSFAMIVIRSAANPPMDENNPENILTLLPYLNREQYGDRPLMFGQTFESIQDSEDPYLDGSPVYYRPNKTKVGYLTKVKVEKRKDQWLVVEESNLYDFFEKKDVIKAINGEKIQPQSSRKRLDLIELGLFQDATKLEIEFERRGVTLTKKINLAKYFVADERKNSVPNYNPKTCMSFPRMYSTQGHHVNAYKTWSNYDQEPERDRKGRVITVSQRSGGRKPLIVPSQLENMRFFINYQFNFMYWRYFMWNFTGRQNDIQGHGIARSGDAVLKGNWLSGVPFVDNSHLGDQSTLPESLKENPGRNEYYFLPLILGIIGMIFHFVRHREDAWIVLLLFLMTGVAIIIYLNQTPFQPRERDYAYAGSFYAFAIWIGLGVQALYSFMLGTNKTVEEIKEEKGKKGIEAKLMSMGIYEISLSALVFVIVGVFAVSIMENAKPFGFSCVFIGLVIFGYVFVSVYLGKLINNNKGKAVFSFLLTGFIPVIMASEGWDDHDRSDKYTARDFAKNYLDSCDKNAIIFTNGDNDTFPLWYVQEVEGYRTDVRVINLSLLNTDWYIDQAKRAAYDGKPVPFSLTQDQYRRGKRDYVFVKEEWANAYHDLKKVMEFVKSDHAATKIPVSSGEKMDYLPTDKFSIPVDSAKVLENGTVPLEFANQIPNRMEWKIKKGAVLKSKLMILDLLAHNNWKRPVYFAITVGNDHYMNLEEYFQLEGLAYRVTPIKRDNKEGTGWINVEKMYDNLVNKFQWGNMEKEGVYMGEQVQRMSTNYRSNFARLARLLCEKEDTVRAIKTLDRCMEIMPPSKIEVDYFSVYLADAYYKAGGNQKGNELMRIIINKYISEVEWYIEQEDHIAMKLGSEVNKSLQYIGNIKYFLDRNIKYIKRRNGSGLKEAEELAEIIENFETTNDRDIRKFLTKVDKASKKSRR